MEANASQPNAAIELSASDLFEQSVIREPFSLYDKLRPMTPMATTDGVWIVMKHDDVFEVLSNPRIFSSNLQHLDNPVLKETPIIFEDPPDHTRHRKLVQPGFTNSRIAAMEPWITDIVRDSIDAFPSGVFDVVTAFCDEVPIKVIATLMGVSVDDHVQFKHWADERTFLVTGKGRPGSSDDTNRWAAAELANRQLLDYFLGQAQARRATPIDDLITDITDANALDGDASDTVIAGTCALLLTAGNVTTTHLLANMLALLADHPTIYQRVRDDRSLIPAVVEEVLRLESPVQWLYRRTTHETELRGVTIPEGASVIVYFGAANRDPETYENPDQFEVGNHAGRHAAFGHGIHFCIGAPLARLEAVVALREIADRISVLSRDPSNSLRASRSATQLGYEHLPMRFDA
jgi:cytochrome P450